MTFKAILYAYILGGITFIPLVIAGLVFFTIYTAVPIGDPDLTKHVRGLRESQSTTEEESTVTSNHPEQDREVQDTPKTRKGWLTMRRTFEESTADGSYVTLMRSFLDSRSNDPKRSRPKDMWYVVLKGKILYLYEDQNMTECEAVIELGGHDVIIYPEGLLDGELFAKRNAICLRPKAASSGMPSLTKEMQLQGSNIDEQVDELNASAKKKAQEKEKLLEVERKKEHARNEALEQSTPWFIFVRSNVEMEDWYISLLHASEYPAQSAMLPPLQPVFLPEDMSHLVVTLDEQPDVIPMRWMNALLGRLFFSYYRTDALEANIVGRLMKKLSKVKRPAFLTDIVVTEVAVGNRPPMFSKPMLKELTKEGDAAMEVHLLYKGDFRITIEATATITLGAFKSYTVKLALAAVIKEIEGNLLIKVKRPPSNRIWYAFTQTPRMVLEVVPIVSDRQLTWGMILSTIESRLKEIIQESIVMPNMDDISFFESAEFERRGGIFADATRREKVSTSINPTDDGAIPVTGEVQVAPSGAEEPVPLPRAQSAEVLIEEAAPKSFPIPPNAAASHSSPAVVASNSGDSPHPKRKSWFSSVNAEDINSLRESYGGESKAEDSERGRPWDVGDSLPQRSKSTSQTAEVPVRNDSNFDFEESSSSQSSLSRSNSRHSSNRDHTKTSSIDSTGSAPDVKSLGSSPNAAATFLSTLKSRDKQAISNTAKETMRKWGVNWGGLRKDSPAASGSRQHSPSPGSDDMPDHGSVGSTLSVGSIVAQKARASYADVRAAVAERKERERNISGIFDVDDLARSATSSPITIPESSKGRTRVVSQSSFLDGNNATTSGASPSRSSNNNILKHLPPMISRTTTNESQASALTPEQPPPQQPSRILVQPKAKTMTIPGIHASHRNDVMSMGFAPSPQPAPPTATEGILKAPAIQSVYRLWKSPAGSPQTQQQANEAEADSNANSVSVSAQPPPLPPRSTPISSDADSLVSSASQALQSIANKDEETRARRSSDLAAVNSATNSIVGSGSSPSRRTSLVQTPIIKPVEEGSVPNVNETKVSNPGPPLPPRRTTTASTLGDTSTS